jgi:UrcA family protein
MSIRYGTSLTLAAAVLTSAVLVSSTAVAAVQTEPVVVTAPLPTDQFSRAVSHRDLDLTLASDQRRLHHRVSSAVKDVCAVGEYHAVRTLAAYSQYSACSKDAWSGARPQIAAAIDRAGSRFAGKANDVASTTLIVSARAGA